MQLPIFKKPRKSHPNPAAFEIYWTRRRMWIAVTWGVLVASAAVSYYFFFFLPQRQTELLELQREEQAMLERIEKAKLEQEKSFRDAEVRQEEYDDLRLESCLGTAANAYVAGWDQECADRGMPPNCRLPNDLAAELDADFKAARDECFKRFKEI